MIIARKIKAPWVAYTRVACTPKSVRELEIIPSKIAPPSMPIGVPLPPSRLAPPKIAPAKANITIPVPIELLTEPCLPAAKRPAIAANNPLKVKAIITMREILIPDTKLAFGFPPVAINLRPKVVYWNIM
jgi:hypothetical protein